MKMKKILLACALLFTVSACAMHHAAPVIRAETLIKSTAEKISFPIVDSSSLEAIENWVANGEAPTNAEISCVSSENTCNRVRNLLTNRGIPVNESAAAADSSAGNVSLTYNRIIAHDCGTNSFGCSTSVNAIHMVTNREQFIKPAMSDLQDAASSVRAVGRFVK